MLLDGKELNLEEKENVKTPATCPFMKAEFKVKLTNFATGEILVDTLHGESEPIKCTGSSCKGALIEGQSAVPKFRTKQDVLDAANKFLQSYYTSSNIHTAEAIQERLNTAKNEIKTTGTYNLTYDELVFGAKLAWRNASRCIGRIQWNKLDVQDCRHMTSTQEMFKALCNHLKHATNNGNIRSMITVFPQQTPGREDFRIWNPQLINFAGYLKPDGSVVGDRGRLHFTRVCQKLGWKGKGGRFDILPWVFSAPGEGVKFYEIPEELILMVDIEHPKYPWFKEMGIKWYALPAVADMMFDVGGISFTAAPFNGWYMCTEIGARNLCDQQRYNITKEIAEKRKLDTTTPTSLWKDFALVEATLAVLYSFQKNKITIVDHHNASQSFITFMEKEQKLRGGCSADWVWIVSPLSGSSLPVFHQEMIVYNLKPSFEYQEKAWLTYKWPVRLKYTLSTLGIVFAAFFDLAKVSATSVRAKVSPTRVQATILFATETGKSETFARRLGKVLKSSFSTRVMSMEDYDISVLKNESFVIMIASTFGSGEPPDNGKVFWTSLKNMKEKHKTLNNLNFAVFALGSSQYPDFCKFGKNLDSCLQDMGAKRLLNLEVGDDLRGQEHTFNAWITNIYLSACQKFQLNDSADITPEINNCTWHHERFRFVSSNRDEQDIIKDLSALHRKCLIPLKMLSSTKLKPSYSDRQTLLIRLKAEDSSVLDYKPGDHIAIYPTNPKYIVDEILQRVENFSYNNSEIIQTECLIGERWTPYDRLPPASLRTYLSKYLDITSPPTSSFLKLLSTRATNKWDKYRLKRLSEVTEDYEEWKNFKFPHLVELLEEFPSISLDPTLLVSELPLLLPRYYSISSSKKATPGEIDITASLVSYKTQGGKGPVHNGVCTFFLNSKPDDEIPCCIRSVSKFHLPKDASCPIIMVGAGSGIAPFRSFWTEREVELQNHCTEGVREGFGPMYLFFGCRQSTTDQLYEQEMSDMMRKGVISNIYTAYSREPGHKKQYVQHKLQEESNLVLSVLKEKGHIYVCGDAVMAADVRRVVLDILTSSGIDTNTNDLLENERYHEDVFGVLHRR